MNAVDKWANPETPKTVNEQIDQLPAVHAVKTEDEIKVELEGFQYDDFYHEKPFALIVKNVAGDRVLYDRLVKHCVEYCGALCKPKITEKKMRGLVSDYEQKYPELIPAPIKEEETVKAGFSGVEKFFGDKEVNYGGYTCTDNGIFDARSLPVKDVCYQPLVISKIKENINSKLESMDISFKRYGESAWTTVTIASENAVSKASLVKVLRPRGGDVTEDSAKDLIPYIRKFEANNHAIIPKAKVSEKIGWTKDGNFVPFTGDIEFDTSRLGAFEDMGTALRAEGDPEVWLNGIREFRKLPTARATILLMDGSFASPLVSLTDALGFWMHMTGNGTTGKTVSMRMAATVWGYAPQKGGFMKTMNQTTNKLEEIANFVNHLPMCLNELQVLQRANPKLFAEFVYKICEGEGRGRLDRNGIAKKAGLFALIALSCGEIGILSDNEHGGAKSRVIDLVLDQPIMPRDQLKPFCDNILNKSYGHAGKMFLEAISSMSVEDIKAKIAEITERLQKFGKATKQIDAAALLLFADEVAEKYIFKDGIRISDEEMIGYLKDDDEIDDNVCGFDVLRSLIVGNDVCFIDKDHHYEPRGETWGKIEESGRKVSFIKGYFDREIRKAGYDPQRLIRWCAEKNNNYVEDGRLDKNGNMKEGESHIDKPVRGLNADKPMAQTRCYVLHMDGGANAFADKGYAKMHEYNSDGEEISDTKIPKGAENVSEFVQTELPF